MDPTSASAQLQTIRTLMERVALYRRALVPCSLIAGTAGTLAAGAGWGLQVGSPAGFLTLWISTAAVTLAAAFLFIRREAISADEPFWTPPTRRVATAFLPSLVAAVLATATITAFTGPESRLIPGLLPSVWMACYGLGLHAAGFFMPRGIRWLGWIFLGASVVLPIALTRTGLPTVPSYKPANLAMGIAFGLGHLEHGLYLRVTAIPAAP
jgi:hypothetical protein